MQNTPAPPDTEHFLRDLTDLRQIGAFKTGVHRPTFSPEDMESRRWLMERMREVGLEPGIDGVGNVLGRHPGAGPKLLVGSHIESQNEAGWLDGALGVMAGVALARAGVACDVIAFADEEGHYGAFIGSRSFTGLLPEAEIDMLANRYHGKPLREALTEAGLAGVPRLAIEAGRYKGFLEMHIEQGTTLEGAGEQVGVVTGIVAIWQYRIVFEGQQDHAGGTTMAERRDAGLAAVRMLAWLDAEMPRHCGERTVWTAGRIAVFPGAPSIIPGRAEVLFQIRDIDLEVLGRLDRRAAAGGAGGQPDRPLHRGAGGDEPVEARAVRPGAAGRAGGGGGGAGAGQVAPDAERGRARRAVHGPADAGGHAVRALHRGDQPPLGGGYQARGPGRGAGGAGGGGAAVPGSVAGGGVAAVPHTVHNMAH